MDQVGKIENINGNIATISVRRPTACGSNCKTCGSNCKQEVVVVKTEITSEYEIGDYVEISTENEVLLKHIVFLYGVPLAIMMATIGAVQLLLKSPNKDMISAFASLLSLVLSFYILKSYDKNQMQKNVLKFNVVKKLY